MRRFTIIVALVLGLVLPAAALAADPPNAFGADRVVALTFDDGPSAYTGGIVDTLRQKGVTATFFMTGRNAQKRPGVARAVVSGGCEVGNHSMVHDYYSDWKSKDLGRDLKDAQAAIRAASGATPRWYKPPYMLWNPAYPSLLRKNGLGLCWPDVAPDDWDGTMTAQDIADAVCADVQPGTVIGLHDGSPGDDADRTATAEAVPLIVDRLHAQGYTFVTLDMVPEAALGRP